MTFRSFVIRGAHAARSTSRASFAALAVAALLVTGTSTQAGPLNLAVDSGLSSFSIKLQLSAAVPLLPPIVVDSPSLSATLSGAAPGFATIPPATTGYLGKVGIAGSLPGTPGTLENFGGGFNFTDISKTLNGPVIPFVGGGSVTLDLKAPHVDIVPGGPYPAISPVVGSADYDFSGLELDLSGGTFSYSSAGYLSFLGSDTINFLPNLFSVNLPPGSIGKIALGPGPPENQLVTLTIPLAMTVPLYDVGNSTLGATLNAIVAGELVLTGISVPEPGSIVLLGLGIVGAIPVLRRHWRRRAR
ncbi:MAG: PEP-CTERM sorting domain-containing protein [Pirellulales bacterium]|nr:PEP-CTERM sorting domain-containing protein [Pirellulales bacterium]